MKFHRRTLLQLLLISLAIAGVFLLSAHAQSTETKIVKDAKDDTISQGDVRSDNYVRADDQHYWIRSWDNSGWILWRDTGASRRRLGWYVTSSKLWWPYAGETREGFVWGPPLSTPPPIPPPKDPKVARERGVDFGKIGKSRFWMSGRGEVSHDEAFGAIESQLPEIAGKLRVTIIGDEATRKRVAEEIAKSAKFQEIKDRVIIQTYGPEHWHVAEVGFQTVGNPCVYAQSEDGRVLHRQGDYAGGAEEAAKALSLAVEALRKPDPNYDPNKDLDLRRKPTPNSPLSPFSPFSPFSPNDSSKQQLPIVAIVFLVAAIVVVFLITSKPGAAKK